MRSTHKKLSIIQDNHFQTKLQEITKLVKQVWLHLYQSKYRQGYQIVNKEFERSLIMETGWQIRIQLLRRGIICIINILRQYNRKSDSSYLQQGDYHSRTSTQACLIIKLIQYIQFYYQILINLDSKQMINMYLNDLLIRIAQILTLIQIQTKSMQAMPIKYHNDCRFHFEGWTYQLYLGHMYSQNAQLNDAIMSYQLSLDQSQQAIQIILSKDTPHQSKQLKQVLKQMIFTLYVMSFIYELQSEYAKVLESLKLAIWLAGSLKQQGITDHLNVQYSIAHTNYYMTILEMHEMGQIIEFIMPQNRCIDKHEKQPEGLWDAMNQRFYQKYCIDQKEFIITQQPIVQSATKLSSHHHRRSTEQETMLYTPRHEKCKTLSFLERSTKTITSPPSNRPTFHTQHKSPKYQILNKSKKLTTEYSEFEERIPKLQLETLQFNQVNKELDLYYQNKVLQSFDRSTTFNSLHSIKEQVMSQEDINKVSQSDVVVGKKILKFQKYSHQHYSSDQNLMKLMSDINRTQLHIESLSAVRSKLSNHEGLERRMTQKLQILRQHTMQSNENQELNLKKLVGTYEQQLGRQSKQSGHTDGCSQIQRALLRSNLNLAMSVEHVKLTPEANKTRKSFLSRVQERLFKIN